MKKNLLLLVFAVILFMNIGFSQTQKVTLSLDFKGYTGSFNYVGVNGGFKDWGNAIALTNNPGTTIWSVTVDMKKNANNEYRFELDGVDGWHGENLSNSECNVSWDEANTNRNLWIGLDASDTFVMNTVCWNSCSSCTKLSTDSLEMDSEISLYPNPSVDGKFELTLPFEASGVKWSLYNSQGQVVFQNTIDSGKVIELNRDESLSAGIYYVKIMIEGKEIVKKLVVN